MGLLNVILGLLFEKLRYGRLADDVGIDTETSPHRSSRNGPCIPFFHSLLTVGV